MSARIVNTIAEAIDDGTAPVTRLLGQSREILDALRANGFEVVELPTQDEVDYYGLYVGRQPILGLGVIEEHDDGAFFRSVKEARRYAAALLAAANAAEATR